MPADIPTKTSTPTLQLTAVGLRLAKAQYAIVVFLFWAALYVYVPTLPTYVQTRTESLATVGVVLSMYGLWQMIVRLPVGIASDWIGRRKPFIVLGLALAGLGAWLMYAPGGVGGLIVGRGITGLAAATWVPLVVVFSSLFPPGDAVRASALLTAAGTLGRIVATGATGWLTGIGGYAVPFLSSVAIAGVAMVLVAPAYEMRLAPRRPSIGQLGRLITRRDVLLPSLLAAVAQFSSWACTFGFLPILAKSLGASDITLSALVTLNLVLNTIGNLSANALANRTSARALAYGGFGLIALGIAASALAHALPFLMVAQCLIGLGIGIAYPVFMGMSIRHVAEGERATAMGLFQAVYAAGMFAGPWLGGLIAEGFGVRPMFGVTAGITLVLGLAGSALLIENSA